MKLLWFVLTFGLLVLPSLEVGDDESDRSLSRQKKSLFFPQYSVLQVVQVVSIVELNYEEYFSAVNVSRGTNFQPSVAQSGDQQRLPDQLRASVQTLPVLQSHVLGAITHQHVQPNDGLFRASCEN